MTISQWIAARRSWAARQSSRLPRPIATLLGGIAAAVSGLFLTNLLGALAQTMIVRQLGDELYGEYASLVAGLSIIASLLGIGLDTWILHHGSRHPTALIRDVWHVLLLKSIGATLALAALALAWQAHTLTSLAFVMGVVWIIFDSFALTGYSALRAIKRNGQVAVFQTLSPLLLLLALWLTRGAGLSPLLLLSVQAGTSAAVTAVMMVRVWRLCGSPAEHSFDLRYVISGAWLFVAADVLATLYTQVGLVLLGNSAPSAEVGHFRAALNVLGFAYLVPSLIFAVGLPLLNEAGVGRRGYRPLLRMMAGGAGLYGLAAWGGLWLLGDVAIRVLYTDEYASALPFVQMMAFLPLVKAASFVAAAVLLSCNRLGLRVGLQAVVTATNLAAASLIIPSHGVAGAMWVIIATELMVCALYLLGALAAFRKTGL
ncbi:MAG: hypothetical protein RLZZ387_5180 [Chloroflexota bacterium]|jgi:O-antigen/teichoic acid export membrane protein